MTNDSNYYDSIELLLYCDSLDSVDLIKKSTFEDAKASNQALSNFRKRSYSVDSDFELPEISETQEKHEYLNGNDSNSLSQLTHDSSIITMNDDDTGLGSKKKHKKHNGYASSTTANYYNNVNENYINYYNFSSTNESVTATTKYLVDEIVSKGINGIDVNNLYLSETGPSEVKSEIALNILNRHVQLEELRKASIEQSQKPEQVVKPLPARVPINPIHMPMNSQLMNNGYQSMTLPTNQELSAQTYSQALTNLLKNKNLNLPQLTPSQIEAIAQNPTFQNNQLITNFLKLNMKKVG